MGRDVDSLKRQINKALGSINETGALNRERDFNFFRATGGVNYEIRHAAFFSWLFDPRQHEKATHFVLHFLRGVSHFLGDDRLYGKLGRLKGNAATDQLVVSPIFKKKSESLSELLTDEGGRIDFACDVFRNSKRVARVVIEFKLKGVVQNDLAGYYKEVEKGCEEKDLYCFVIDFSGKAHLIEGQGFLMMETGVLIESVNQHMKYLSSLSDKKYLPVAQAVSQYYDLLREHVGVVDVAIKDKRNREIFWNLWAPEMEGKSVVAALDSHLSEKADRVLVGEAAEEAYYHRWWQLISTSDLFGFLGRQTFYSVSMSDGYTINVKGRLNSEYNDIKVKVSVVLGEWVGLVGNKNEDFKEKIYLRIHVRSMDVDDKDKGARRLATLERGLLNISDDILVSEDRARCLADSKSQLSTAAFIEREGRFVELNFNRRNKVNSLDRTLVFLVEVDKDELKKSAVIGAESGNVPNSYKLIDCLLRDFMG